jgi:hypothetical protein
MRAVFLIALVTTAGCDSLWRPFDRNHPENCVADPTVCDSDQFCDPMTELCQDAIGSSDFPSSCTAFRALHGATSDGVYTVYIGGDESKPWDVYCHNMADQPAEFLTLPSGGSANYSQYTAGGASMGSTVITFYEKVRLDPNLLLIDISNQQFSNSMGQLVHSSTSDLVTSMPYGVAMDCVMPGLATGVANVDVRNTPFSIGPNAFVKDSFPAPPPGTIAYSENDQVVNVTGGGFCGWTMPAPTVNPPYNRAGTFQLPVIYIGN